MNCNSYPHTLSAGDIPLHPSTGMNKDHQYITLVTEVERGLFTATLFDLELPKKNFAPLRLVVVEKLQETSCLTHSW